ncbi:MAG: rod shape-determining protein MreC [Bacteroidia bacterium]|jgi:rod shape-determining protein MreC|nr:rod shape-determining protein MreC [Bacteroidia bacterium]
MYGILEFFKRNYFSLLFAALEFFSLYFVFRDNYYHQAGYFNSSDAVAGSVYKAYNGITGYFGLAGANEELAAENARLHTELLHADKGSAPPAPGFPAHGGNTYNRYFDYTPAEVLDNSTARPDNFMTLDVGNEDGVREGMGVVSPAGIVGIVVNTSAHFSVVMSILNKNCKVSAMLKKSGAFGTLNWKPGETDIHHALLLQIPMSEQLKPGDTIVTSGYSTIFPKDIMVGVLESYKPVPEQYFYTINVKLSVKFKSIRYVYVIKNLRKEEKTSLEQNTYKEEE